MADLELPAYRPVYPITKNVRPRQSQTRLPSSWGIEQRKTVGKNQTALEWNVKWILEESDANILDAFLFERAKNNQSFLWAPPGYPQARYRCDDWTKTMFDLSVSDIQATFVRIYDYDNLITFSLENDHYSVDIQNIDFGHGYFINIDTCKLDACIVQFDSINTNIDDVANFDIGTFIEILFTRNYLRSFDTISIPVNIADVNLSKGIASDYFGGFHSQVYGWDRDFQVDWWAD